MSGISAGAGAGDLPEADAGTISFEGLNKKAICEHCKIITLHVFSGRWFCKKCGQSNNELAFAELNADMNEEEFDTLSTTDVLDFKSTGTSPTVPDAIGSLTEISIFNENGKKIKIKTHELLASTKKMKNLMKTVTTDFERQILWNRDLFYASLMQIGINPRDYDKQLNADDRELRRMIRRIWQKTLHLKIQKGRNALANIIACFIIAMRIQGIRYEFEDFISQFDDILDEHILRPNHIQANDTKDYHFSIKNKVFYAERLIIERVFTKPKCTWNKISNKEETPKDNNSYIYCYRMNRSNIPPKNMKEEISVLMSELQESELDIAEPQIVLQDANNIFDDAEKNGLISGLPPRTLTSAIILLSLNKTSSVTAEIMAEELGIEKTYLKKHADSINKGLKLGIEIKLF